MPAPHCYRLGLTGVEEDITSTLAAGSPEEGGG